MRPIPNVSLQTASGTVISLDPRAPAEDVDGGSQVQHCTWSATTGLLVLRALPPSVLKTLTAVSGFGMAAGCKGSGKWEKTINAFLTEWFLLT